MSDKVFNIVFRGEIVLGANEAAVKANVAKLFKASEQVLARLFSGEEIAIKKNVDKAGAMKYRALMKQAGAICYAVELGEELATAAAKPKPSAPAASAPNNSRQVNKPTPVNKDAAASQSISQEQGWSLAPAGSILVQSSEISGIEIPDIEGITMAEVGVDIVEHQASPKFEPRSGLLDISLAPVGSDVADPVEKISVSIPDVSNIDLAPVGSDVADPVDHQYPEPPDVSGIDLAPPGSDVANPSPRVPEPTVDISHITLE